MNLPLSRNKLADLAHGLMVAIAICLPWSTSAVSILVVLWVLAVLPTLEWRDLGADLMTPSIGLPIVLLTLGILGMTWTNADLHAQWGGLTGFLKLAALPIAVAQYRQSGQGRQVLVAFVATCATLLFASFVTAAAPKLAPHMISRGVPVKDYISQSLEFVVCAALVSHFAAREWAKTRPLKAFWLTGLALLFLINIFYIELARTSLVVLAVLSAIYVYRNRSIKVLIIATLIVATAFAALWATSPFLRHRVAGVYSEIELARIHNQSNSSGERLVFWEKSIRFIASAPLIGNGTGSIVGLFQSAIEGTSGPASLPSSNPHNQTLAIGIQLGCIGIAVLWLMWICQWLTFRAPGSVNWIGTVFVLQNVVGSLFNSFIFDFTSGWLYVFGVGIAAGMARRNRAVGVPPAP